ncbi:MAG: hydantoinase/oxoprolinase family protein [Gaiella sp.]
MTSPRVEASRTPREAPVPDSSAYRLGVDIGGTFTDVVLLGEDGTMHTRKVLSTPGDYSVGVVKGTLQLLSDTRVGPEQLTAIVHATTVASNTVLEERGAATGLVTTEGFRDVLEMRRLRIPVMYDLQYDKPDPLVPRRRRYEVPERSGPDGAVWRELDESAVRAVAERLADDRVGAVAVSFLHAYANPAHELAAARVLREVIGDDVYLTCSAEILPEIREYERTSTAVVNAYVGPAVSSYLQSLEASLREHGIVAPLEIMQSSGGTMSVAAAVQRPAYLVESGPAAGVIACAHLARLTAQPNMISFDMGGTTAKAAMLEDGEPVRTTEYEVGSGINLSSRLVKGGGHAIKLPFIDVSEIGAGGGSIVAVDGLGAASVGPRSAGADPGPVCYGKGGEEPALADALLVLGYLDPEALAGGAVPLDRDAAERAFATHVAEPLGLPLLEAAYGVLQVAVATMTRAVKAVSTYRGRDPREFTLCAFGGNGPVVGVEIARALSMSRVLVPPAPGVFSAVGLLYSSTEREFVSTVMLRAGEIAAEAIGAAYEALAEDASAALQREGISLEVVTFARFADLRYAGQAYELTVRVPDGQVDVDALLASFVDEHVRTYGHGSPSDPIDLVSVRVIARKHREAPTRLIVERDHRPVGGRAGRRAYFGPERGVLDVPVLGGREALGADDWAGPLIIDEYDSSTIVPPGARARLDEYGSIEIDVV